MPTVFGIPVVVPSAAVSLAALARVPRSGVSPCALLSLSLELPLPVALPMSAPLARLVSLPRPSAPLPLPTSPTAPPARLASFPCPSISFAMPTSVAAPAAILASLPHASLALPLPAPPSLAWAPGFVLATAQLLAAPCAGLPPGLLTGVATRGLFASGMASGGAGAFTVDSGERTFLFGGVAEFAVDAET